MIPTYRGQSKIIDNTSTNYKSIEKQHSIMRCESTSARFALCPASAEAFCVYNPLPKVYTVLSVATTIRIPPLSCLIGLSIGQVSVSPHDPALDGAA